MSKTILSPNNQIKSGQDIIDEFFSEILSIKDVDPDITKELLRLYSENKLTNINIQNMLDDLLHQKLTNENSNDKD